MSKKVCLTLLIMLLCVNLPGCGKSGNTSSTDGENSTNSSSMANSSNSGNKETSPATDTPSATDSIPEETASPEPASTPEPEPEKTPGKAQKAKPKIEIISQEQQYTDGNRTVKVLGLKEYKNIEGETYTDKAGKGKKFLVLFLSIKNTTSEEDYINYNYISAKVDGKKTEHTFLVNEPKSYPTIFTHVPAGSTIGGFIVWKVPEDWKKLDFTYNGWKDRDNISMKAEFTPDDLSEPLIYNANKL